MKPWRKILVRAVVFSSLLFTLVRSEAQGTLQWNVTFDGSPPIARSTEVATNYYAEQGMEFRPIGNGQFGRSGGAAADFFPRNGSAYLVAFSGYSLAASYVSGQRFGVVSVDLAEFSTLYQTPLTVQFVGYRPDGSTVSTAFVTDGVIDGAGPLADFQTFYLDSQFADVVRVEVPPIGWSLDNMVFSQVPEPATSALLFVGASLLWALRFRR